MFGKKNIVKFAAVAVLAVAHATGVFSSPRSPGMTNEMNQNQMPTAISLSDVSPFAQVEAVALTKRLAKRRVDDCINQCLTGLCKDMVSGFAAGLGKAGEQVLRFTGSGCLAGCAASYFLGLGSFFSVVVGLLFAWYTCGTCGSEEAD